MTVLATVMRVGQKVRDKAQAALVRGSGRTCPLCEQSVRRFVPFRGRPEAKCPHCASMERHREAWLVLSRNTPILEDSLRVLHIAPEPSMRRRLRLQKNLDYVTGDLLSGDADLVLDITAMDLPDESVDVVMASHVLEHVPDDLSAMKEIRRVLKPSGFAMLVVPHDVARQTTYEDWTIIEPKAREVAFGQWDHVRWYAGADFDSRLRSVGFSVEHARGSEDARERELYGLDGPGIKDWSVIARKV